MAGIQSMGSPTSRTVVVEQKSFRHHHLKLPRPSPTGTLLATSGLPTGMEVSTLPREPPHQTRGASRSQQQQRRHRAKERKRFQAQCFRPRSTDRKSRARKVLQSACSVVAVRRRRSETARKTLSQTGIRRGRTSHHRGRRGVTGTTACHRSRRATRRTPTTATHPATLTRTTSTAKCLVTPTAGRYPSPQPQHITLAHALLGLHHRHKAQEEPKSSGTVTTSHCPLPSQASTSRFHLPNRSHSAGQTASHPA